MDIMSNFAESIKELIGETKISEISAKVNISIPVIYKYLRKESMPKLHNAVSLAKYFECTLDYLFGLSDKRERLNGKELLYDTAFRNVLSEAKCTRYILQKQTQIPSQSIDDWYHGKREPSIPHLIKVASYLGCTLDKLAGLE